MNMISDSESLANNYRDDMVVNADLFDCIDSIPDRYFDLIIIDPPYNLDKDFHGNKFSSMTSNDYEDYLTKTFYYNYSLYIHYLFHINTKTNIIVFENLIFKTN